MFLKTTFSAPPHELDIRFEARGPQGFLFVNHGLSLVDLAETLDLSFLGSFFYMVEAGISFTLADAVKAPALLKDRFGFEPAVAAQKYLAFDREALGRFCLGTRNDCALECTIAGASHAMSDDAIDAAVAAIDGAERRDVVAHRWGGSLLSTHDNHFTYVEAASGSDLRRLVAESLVGFFQNVRPHPYSPPSKELLDRLLAGFHTASLVCSPTRWDDRRLDVVPGDVLVSEESVWAYVETCESHGTGYRLGLPKELLGRGLIVSYALARETWSSA